MPPSVIKISRQAVKILFKNDTGINRYSSIFAVKSFHILLYVGIAFYEIEVTIWELE